MQELSENAETSSVLPRVEGFQGYGGSGFQVVPDAGFGGVLGIGLGFRVFGTSKAARLYLDVEAFTGASACSLF